MGSKAGWLPDFSQLLPYEEVEGNRIFLRDGTIAGCIRLAGLYCETKTPAGMNTVHRNLYVLLNALASEASYQMYWVRSDRLDGVPPDQPECINTVAEGLRAARRIKYDRDAAAGNLHDVKIYLFVISRFQTRTEQKKWRRAFTAAIRPALIETGYLEDHSAAVAQAERLEAVAVEALEKAGFKPKRVAQEELLELIWRHLNPDLRLPRPINLCARAPWEWPQLDLHKEWGWLQIGNSFLRVISLRRLPEETYPGMIQQLTHLTIKAWLSVNFRRSPMASELARLRLKRNLAEAFRREHGRNVRAEVAINEALQMEKDLVTGDEALFNCEWILTVTASSRSELDRVTQDVLMTLQAMNGATGIEESAANLKLWLSGLPGNGVGEGDYRFHRILTRNLADLFPAYSPYMGIGMPRVLLETTEGTLARFDPFCRSLPNFNSLVFGASGGGKSFLVQYLCMQVLQDDPRTRIIFVDLGGSYEKLVEAFGGETFRISDDGRFTINPLAAGPVDQRRPYLSAVLTSMIHEEGFPLRNDERIVIETAIGWAINRWGHLSIGRMVQALKETPFDLDTYREISHRMSRHLERWTMGVYGRLLDNNERSELAITGDITAIDLKGLEPYPELMTVFLMYITELIWSVCQNEPGRRKLIVFDEVWSLLGNEIGGRLISELYRTLRKYGAGIISVSQSLKDFESTPQSRGILANVGTVFVLKQSGAVNNELVRQALNLSEREARIILEMGQVKGEYADVLVTGEMSFVARVAPTPLEYWLASTDPADRAELARRPENESLWQAVERLAHKWPKGVM